MGFLLADFDGLSFFWTMNDWLYGLESSLRDFATGIVAVLVAAAVIYTTFLVWRKYRAAVNKV